MSLSFLSFLSSRDTKSNSYNCQNISILLSAILILQKIRTNHSFEDYFYCFVCCPHNVANCVSFQILSKIIRFNTK